MKNYSDIIEINSIFSTSVNLWIDFNNEGKIKQYIPTKEASLILNYYLHSILNDNKENQNFRATTLVGPYGKGKSFLLLVLMFIISHDSSNKTWKKIRDDFSLVNKETSDLMDLFDQKKLKLMPILINNDYSTLRQAFLVALSQSLDDNGVADIMPETSFDVALDIVKKWETDMGFLSTVEAELKKGSSSLVQLKKGLTEKEGEAYSLFVNTYNKVIKGQAFNPLIGDSLPATIRSVANALSTEKEYTGIFFVFDEFSKYLDTDNAFKSEELRTLQDIYELCNSSNFESQIHICSVIHKSIAYYAKDKSLVKRNSFKTIEGRVKELFFNRSVLENFRLIEHAILKKKTFDSEFIKFKAGNNKFYEDIGKTELRSFCDSQLLEQGCFPFNPFSVYALIALSEKIAQNERTIFTFLSDNDPYSFNSFIKNNSKRLLDVDQLYDYFSSIFISSEDDLIKRIYYKTRICLSSVEDKIGQRVIKALAIINMIDDRLAFPPTIDSLRLATRLSNDDINNVIENLKTLSYLRESPFNGHLSFSGVNSAAINEKLNDLVGDKNFVFQIADTFTIVSDERYAIPRRYNAEIKMTRYYRVVYMEADTFFKLGDLSILSEGRPYADGNVIKIIYTEEDSTIYSKIKEKFKQLYDKVSIVIIPDRPISDKEYLCFKQYNALEELSNTLKDEQDRKEVLIMKEELEGDLKLIVKAYFEKATYYPNEKNSLSEMMSEQLSKVYTKTPKVNNELLNINTLRAAYKKARTNILNVLLGNISLSVYKPTSPEVTIYNAVFKGDKGECVASVKYCINYISNILTEVQDGRSELFFKTLVNPMLLPPYGVRKGILPLLIMKAIQDLPENDFVLELDKSELPLTAENIIKATEDEKGKYKFKVLSNLSERKYYIADLMAIFGVASTDRLREDIQNLINTIKVYCLNLPGVVKASTVTNNIVGISDESISFVSGFLKIDINPYEKIFEQLPRLSGKRMSYSDTIIMVRDIKDCLDSALEKYENRICGRLLKEFHCEQEGMASFVAKYSSSDINGSLDDLIQVLNEASKELPCDDNKVLDQISLATLRQHIRDWNYDKSDDLINSVKDVLANEISEEQSKLEQVISGLSDLDMNEEEDPLENNLMYMLRDSLDSFGDSLTKTQKISVLIKLIKEIE